MVDNIWKRHNPRWKISDVKRLIYPFLNWGFRCERHALFQSCCTLFYCFVARSDNGYQSAVTASIFNASGENIGSSTIEYSNESIDLKVKSDTDPSGYTTVTRKKTILDFSGIFLETDETYTIKFYNDAGSLVGFGYSVVKPDANGNANWTPAMEITATLVPEPTALALLALGVAGLALRRKVA